MLGDFKAWIFFYGKKKVLGQLESELKMKDESR